MESILVCYDSPLRFIDVDGNIPWSAVFGDEVTAWISSLFAWRIHPIKKNPSFHDGIDLPVKAGTNVRSLADGVVTDVKYDEVNGNHIIVNHGQGYVSMYLHLKDKGTLVNVGDQVQNGQVIGLVGSTGSSTGPHLHLIIQVNGKKIDPTSVKDLQEEISEFSGQFESIDLESDVLTTLADSYRKRMSKITPGSADYLDYKVRLQCYEERQKELRQERFALTIISQTLRLLRKEREKRYE
jgi:murein DD-endopeptidase MepM/ murein hydrolase activator NlpD